MVQPFRRENWQRVTRDTQLFVPLDILIPLGETHRKEITPAPSPMLQKRHLQKFSKHINEKTYIYIFKGTGAPKYKRMKKKKRTSEWTMWMCVTCVEVRLVFVSGI